MNLRPRGEQAENGAEHPPSYPGSEADDDEQENNDRNQHDDRQRPNIPNPPPLHYYQPNMIPRQTTPVQYIKNLASFKNGSDLLIFLHRFNRYCQALRVPENMKSSLIISHLDDQSLRGISRHLNEDLTYEEVVDLLKKSQGYAPNNTDKHITDMSARKRLKTEKIMDYFVDLSRISELAYPNQDQRQIREANLRQEFIKNINHPMIAARLRENPTMPMEDLLDFAILLENCYEASKVTPNQVNFMSDEGTNDATNTKINNLANMVEKLVINQVEHDTKPEQPYKYEGDRIPKGLQNNGQDSSFRCRSPSPYYRSRSEPKIFYQEHQPSNNEGRGRSWERNERRDNYRPYYNNRYSGGYSPGNFRYNTQYNRPVSQQNFNNRGFNNNFRNYNNSNYRNLNNNYRNQTNNYRNQNNNYRNQTNNYRNQAGYYRNQANNNNNNNNNYNNRQGNRINHIQNFRRGRQPRQTT